MFVFSVKIFVTKKGRKEREKQDIFKLAQVEYLFQQIVCFCLGFGSHTDLAVFKQAPFKEHLPVTCIEGLLTSFSNKNDEDNLDDQMHFTTMILQQKVVLHV